MNSVSLKKLEFDKVANYAAQFCMSGMGRDRVMAALPVLEREVLLAELERVLELKNLRVGEAPLPFS